MAGRNPMTHLDFLRNVSLFESLDQQELEALSDVTFTRTFSKDNVIILAEEEGDTLFILKNGQVKVSIVSEEGREVILSLLGPGSVFGELSLLDGKPRSANVVATEETDLLMLRRSDFLQLIYKTPQIATALLAELATRMRKTDRQIEGLALLDVTSRISDTLLQLATEQGAETADGVTIESRPTHQELANMSGTTRETVSRVLKRLEGQGYINRNGRKITILREEAWKT
jgi:CRP/FNR family transcriptional regulator/CRP/FNR family cyclic AMP-dependent transcriptional regulator